MPEDQGSPPHLCIYTVKRGDTLLDILHDRGLKHQNLYGSEAWLYKNKRLNPSIDDWTQLEPGTKLNLKFPFPVSPACDVEGKPVAMDVPQPSLDVAPEPELPTPKQEEVAAPPQSMAQPAIPEAATPSPEISSEDQSEKRDDMDAAKLIKDLTSASVDLRYGKSLEPSNDSILLPKVAQFSLMFESHFEAFQKLRIYFDYTPRVSDTYLSQDFSVESTRLVAGRAFL